MCKIVKFTQNLTLTKLFDVICAQYHIYGLLKYVDHGKCKGGLRCMTSNQVTYLLGREQNRINLQNAETSRKRAEVESKDAELREREYQYSKNATVTSGIIDIVGGTIVAIATILTSMFRR